MLRVCQRNQRSFSIPKTHYHTHYHNIDSMTSSNTDISCKYVAVFIFICETSHGYYYLQIMFLSYLFKQKMQLKSRRPFYLKHTHFFDYRVSHFEKSGVFFPPCASSSCNDVCADKSAYMLPRSIEFHASCWLATQKRHVQPLVGNSVQIGQIGKIPKSNTSMKSHSRNLPSRLKQKKTCRTKPTNQKTTPHPTFSQISGANERTTNGSAISRHSKWQLAGGGE